MHNVTEEEINAITLPVALFTQPNKIDSTELSNTETTPAEKHQENGALPSLGTQLPQLVYWSGAGFKSDY